MERQIVNPWTWQERFGFVQANSTSGATQTLHCSGQTSVGPDGAPLHEGDMIAQAEQALENLEAVLREGGCRLADVVRLNYYTTDVDAFFPALEVLTARLREANCQPASTLLGVSRLALPSLLVELEATAVV